MHFPAEKCTFLQKNAVFGGHMAGNRRKLQEGFRAQESRTLATFHKIGLTLPKSQITPGTVRSSLPHGCLASPLWQTEEHDPSGELPSSRSPDHLSAACTKAAKNQEQLRQTKPKIGDHQP